MNEQTTITLDVLFEQAKNYKHGLPVYIRIGDEDYPIDDVFFATDADGQNGRIMIEMWSVKTASSMGKKGGAKSKGGGCPRLPDDKISKYALYQRERRKRKSEAIQNENDEVVLL
jgi:hypothetical protein